MAQKTPLPALTINYADRWNATWFSDLSGFKEKLKEDFYLRFLILSYLRKKKYWLHLLSINNSAGFFFFQIVFVNTKSQPTLKPFLFPNNFSKSYLQNWEKELNQNNPLFKREELKLWQKRLSYKKENMWLTLNRRILLKNSKMSLFVTKSFQANNLNPLNINAPKNATSLADQSLEEWFALQTSHLTLAFAQPALYFLFQRFTKLNTLLKIINSNPMSDTDFVQDLPFSMVKLLKKNYVQNKNNNKNSKLSEKNNNLNTLKKNYTMPSVHFSTITKYLASSSILRQPVNSSPLISVIPLINGKNIKRIKRSKESQNSLNSLKTRLIKFNAAPTSWMYLQLKKTAAEHHINSQNYYINHLAQLVNFRKKRAIYQNVSHLKSYLFQRAFAFKTFSSVTKGLLIFFKRFGPQYNFQQTVVDINSSLPLLTRALQRVTGTRIFLSYLPLQWNHQLYHPLKKYTVFEKFGFQKYFVPTMVGLHLAMSRGSAILLMDILLRKLRNAYKHNPFLSCVEKICRYFTAYPGSNIAYEDSICKGIEILFCGKVNGQERSRVWRYKFGPVHTSTFYTNTREEHAKCVTRYGVFHLRVRMKLGSFV
jgi:hypothetical protein